MPKLCAISIDLDEVHHYEAIHGLGSTGGADPHAVYDRALPRFVDFARSHSVPLSFFAVGADLERPRSARRLRDAAELGHEIGNHTQDHDYGLSRRPVEQIIEQVRQASERIAARTGRRPVGFRAPGYSMHDRVYEALSRCDVEYSSSVFPCPHYYLAKLGAIGAKALRGRASSSIVTNPSVLTAPTRPYRVGRPYYRRGNGLRELPIQVTPGLRLPYIGTALTLAGPTGARFLTRQLLGESFVNLELHGVDLLDRHDGLEGLSAHQIDLRVPLERKWRTLGAVVDELAAAGYRFVTLAAAARSLLP